ncbi:MAG: sn-glycerol-3-phosphate ABC transporter substrate-binding protein, partial [Cronobacter sakazakii]|nr:sn-glycerol-3-phosphate ABC transporter substrate-binding protein [Cronobacter sakazakii]
MLAREHKTRDFAHLKRRIIREITDMTASLRRTAICVALGWALSSQAMAATTIPFWHSMEGELGKEVNSLAQRFNEAHPEYKIEPVYK